MFCQASGSSSEVERAAPETSDSAGERPRVQMGMAPFFNPLRGLAKNSLLPQASAATLRQHVPGTAT
jgi:hypothetical protein